MTFDAISMPLALLMLGLLALLILACYLLRPPPVRLRVPTDEIWRRLLELQKKQQVRWRWWLSLLMSLLVGLALLMAIFRVRSHDTEFDALLVVLDTGPSMMAKHSQEKTRFALAQKFAAQLIENAPRGKTVIVADTRSSLLPLRLATPESALERLAGLEPAALSGSPHAARLPDAVAASLPSGRQTRRVLLTDGVSLEGISSDQLAGYETMSVFEPVSNLAITRFAGNASADGSEQAILALTNHGSTSDTGTILVKDQTEQVLIERPITLEPGETWTAAIDLMGARGSAVEATIRSPADGFASDDSARMLRGNTLLSDLIVVADDPTFLAELTSAQSGLRIERMTRRQAERADLGRQGAMLAALEWAPETPLAVPMLFFAPPATSWLPQPSSDRSISHSVSQLGLAVHGAGEELPLALALSDLAVARSQPYPSSSPLALASSGNSALLLGKRGTESWLIFPFRPRDSTLESAVGWPVLWQQALSWLQAPDGEYSNTDSVVALDPNRQRLQSNSPLALAESPLPWRLILTTLALLLVAIETWTLQRRFSE